MNDTVSEEPNIEHEPKISIELDGSVIELPLSTFNNILEKEITKFILKRETDVKDIIDLNELVNVQSWRLKFKDLERQAILLHSVLQRLKRDLKDNKRAQPERCMAASVSQYVNISTKTPMANAHMNSNDELQIFTISDSDDDDSIIIIETSKTQTENENVIDLIDSDDDTQNLSVKSNPDPKSKSTSVSIPDLKINDNDNVLPINTEASKSLNNGKCLSTTVRKRKPGPKSKTMFVDDIVPENNETVEKKKRLNECDDINNKGSNSKNVLNCNSAKKLEVPEKYNHNFLLKSSSLKYPPPYPSIPPHNNQPSWKNVPPIPNMTIKTSGNKVTLTWDLHLTWQTAKIKMYELFVCQETDAPPKSSMWKKKGEIKADLLPMACELEVFELGYIYHFALRAVDVHNRRAPFALQKTKI